MIRIFIVLTKTKYSLLLFLILSIFTNIQIFAEPDNETSITQWHAKKYAPLIYLHQDEEFYPSSVEYFFNYVDHDFTNPFFTTKQKLNCPSCTNLEFFRGQPVVTETVPVYAIITPKPNLGKNITDISYWTFYPYNRGKRACISPIYINGNCWGKYSTFGHHVGDWEHITVRLKKQKPIKIYLSQHADGASYDWGDYNIEYKQETHPVLYSAQGSHGYYSTPGNHVYKKLFNGDKLMDKTNRGIPWYTWLNIKSTKWALLGSYNKDFYWMNYVGRWGNSKEGCTFLGINFEKMFKNCILNAGPTGPSLKNSLNPSQNCYEDEFFEKVPRDKVNDICTNGY